MNSSLPSLYWRGAATLRTASSCNTSNLSSPSPHTPLIARFWTKSQLLSWGKLGKVDQSATSEMGRTSACIYFAYGMSGYNLGYMGWDQQQALEFLCIAPRKVREASLSIVLYNKIIKSLILYYTFLTSTPSVLTHTLSKLLNNIFLHKKSI